MDNKTKESIIKNAIENPLPKDFFKKQAYKVLGEVAQELREVGVPDQIMQREPDAGLCWALSAEQEENFVRLHAQGSIALSMGHYLTAEDMDREREKRLNYKYQRTR